MSSPAIATVIKMMESLSEDVQERVAEHLREYLEDLQDELKWNRSFNKTQQQLIASAQSAKRKRDFAKFTLSDRVAKPIAKAETPIRKLSCISKNLQLCSIINS